MTDTLGPKTVDLSKQEWRDLRPDAQAFDEVRIVTVPRYKQSGLSGDQWRISASVRLMRKGKIICERGFRDVATACGFLYAMHAEAIDDGNANFGGIDDFCDQEGCSNKATVTYLKIANYCHDGHASVPHRQTIRCFCDVHKRRGDCGLDDADANYKLWPHKEPQGANDENK